QFRVARLVRFEIAPTENGQVLSVWLKEPGKSEARLDLDAPGYFVLPTPIRETYRLGKELISSFNSREGLAEAEAAGFADLIKLIDRNIDANSPLQRFAGVQFVLREDHRFFPGHMYYPSSPWALTSISQLQFRTPFDDPTPYEGIVSVVVADWKTPGRT